MSMREVEQTLDLDRIATLTKELARQLTLPAVEELAEILAHRHSELHLIPEEKGMPSYQLEVKSLVGARWHEPGDEKDTSGPLDIDFLSWPDHRNLISRLHARLLFDEGLWRVEDCSKVGTWVNGERVKGSCLLNHGDRICFAHLCFEVALKPGEKVD